MATKTGSGGDDNNRSRRQPDEETVKVVNAAIDQLCSRLAPPQRVMAAKTTFELPKNVEDAVRTISAFVAEYPDNWRDLVLDKITDEGEKKEALRALDPRTGPTAWAMMAGLPNQDVEAEKQETPLTLADLAKLVLENAHAGKAMKAVCHGYSFSDVVDTQGCLIHMGNLNQITRGGGSFPIESGVDTERVFEVQGGATLHDVNEALKEFGMALENQPGFAELGMVSTMSVSAHGSGSPNSNEDGDGGGPMPSFVLALQMLTVDEDGGLKFWLVEPAAAPVLDPSLAEGAYGSFVKGKLGNTEFKVQHVADNDLFNACVVGLGCMGIVVSILLLARPAFYIHETRREETWESISSMLKQASESVRGIEAHNFRNKEVWVNPYLLDKCVLTEREEVSANGSSGSRGTGLTGDIAKSPLLRWFVTGMSHVPGLWNLLPRVLHEAMKQTTGDVTCPSYSSFDFGTPNFQQVDCTELHLPFDKTVEFANQMIDLLRDLARNKHCFITSPFSLRFVHSSSALMSPQVGQVTCTLEFPILKGTKGIDVTLGDIMNLGRPVRQHWGLKNNLTAKEVRLLYEDTFSRFATSRARMDPRNVFANKFTRRIGLSLPGAQLTGPPRKRRKLMN